MSVMLSVLLSISVIPNAVPEAVASSLVLIERLGALGASLMFEIVIDTIPLTQLLLASHT